jgi:hypothetical protein
MVSLTVDDLLTLNANSARKTAGTPTDMCVALQVIVAPTCLDDVFSRKNYNGG